MPIHLAPLNRRQFLVGSLAAGAGLLSLPALQADDGAAVDPHRFALLADTHIPTDPETENGGIKMAEHFRRVSEQLIQSDPPPAGVMIVGDCAFQKGLSGDYALLGKLLEGVRQSGLTVHLALGNHDDRQVFYDVLLRQRPEQPPVAGKHVTIIEAERANLFLLDSLMEVNVVTGELGAEQFEWLAKGLDAHADKPAIIIAHHPLQWTVKPGETIGGLKDTAAFFDVLRPRKQVKAFIFGHTHHWHVGEQDGIHLVNLPPVAYVFNKADPSGWAELELGTDRMSITLRALDSEHKAHRQKHELVWRTG